jgi:transposase
MEPPFILRLKTRTTFDEPGFPKKAGTSTSQILLGLLVSLEGYPLAHKGFEAGKSEGHTLLPVIEAFKSKYQLDKLVFIADAGLLCNDNMEELHSKHYEFILGVRIKIDDELPGNLIRKSFPK